MPTPDGDLAILALRVAQQVDRRLGGRDFDQTVLTAFRQGLSRATGSEQQQPASFLHSDPLTTEIFAQAVNEVSENSVSDVVELSAAINKIVEPLAANTNNASDADFSLIKTFCLSLHRSIMSQKLPAIPGSERQFDDELGILR